VRSRTFNPRHFAKAGIKLFDGARWWIRGRSSTGWDKAATMLVVDNDPKLMKYTEVSPLVWNEYRRALGEGGFTWAGAPIDRPPEWAESDRVRQELVREGRW